MKGSPNVIRAALALCLAASFMPFLSTSVKAADAAPDKTSCAATAEFHLLDFWVGRWNVYAGKTVDGTDVVQKILGGCALTETWSGTAGDKGMSLFYFNAFTHRWTQVWVTDSATQLGGLKEKYFVGSPGGNAVRFAGTLPGLSRGRPVLDRTTLTPMPDHTVHQVIEVSTDGGETWKATYDASYVPVP